MEKIRLAFSLMRSKAYVVVTETTAVMSMKLTRPDKFKDLLSLSLQLTALRELEAKIRELADEYERAYNMEENDE